MPETPARKPAADRTVSPTHSPRLPKAVRPATPGIELPLGHQLLGQQRQAEAIGGDIVDDFGRHPAAAAPVAEDRADSGPGLLAEANSANMETIRGLRTSLAPGSSRSAFWQRVRRDSRKPPGLGGTRSLRIASSPQILMHQKLMAASRNEMKSSGRSCRSMVPSRSRMALKHSARSDRASCSHHVQRFSSQTKPVEPTPLREPVHPRVVCPPAIDQGTRHHRAQCGTGAEQQDRRPRRPELSVALTANAQCSRK